AVRQQNARPLPPSTYNDEVSETLGAAVLRALDGDPSRRYASADDLAEGLQRGLHGEDVTLPLAEGGTPTSVMPGGETATRRLDPGTGQTEVRPAPSQTRRPPPRAAQRPAQRPAAPPPAPRRPARRGAFSRFVR